MSGAWASVPLGEVVRHRKEFVAINDVETYRRPRVQLHAQGIVLRDTVPGAIIKTKKQQVVRSGEFLVAEIDAKVGGFGIVPNDLDGAIVSSHYFIYGCNADRLDNRYLGWFVKTRAFREQVAAQGSTNYAAIRAADVLEYQIPLPSLEEQRRIVRRIEELALKIRDVLSLRMVSADEQAALLEAIVRHHFDELAVSYPGRTLASCDAHVSSGPRNWGKHYSASGLRFYRAQDIGRDFRISKENVVFVEPPPGQQGRSARVMDGDLLIVITGATVGRVAVFNNSLEAGLVSQHVAVCRVSSAVFHPRFLLWGLRGTDGQEQLLGSKYGQGKPGLNLKQIGDLSMPCPPIELQERIVDDLDAIQAKVDAASALQVATAAEIDALLPSILDKAFKGHPV